MEKRSRGRQPGKRRLILALLAVCLIMSITSGVTLAWLGGVTGEEDNVFTGSENVRAKIDEPNWNAEEGLNLVPGKTVRKDPMIINTGYTEEYVALRLTFRYKDGTMIEPAGTEDDLLRLLNLLEITWNGSWTLHSGTLTPDGSGGIAAVTQPLVFIYEQSLMPGDVSEPVFSSIRVKEKSDGLTEPDLRWLQGIKFADGEAVTDPDGLGGFDIQVEGAAVQAQGITDAAGAADILTGLFP